jgi:predicted Rossmann-fold nucleotide-binding protein
VLYDSKFWKSLINFPKFAEAGMVSKADLDLFGFADSPREAWQLLLKRGLKVPGV